MVETASELQATVLDKQQAENERGGGHTEKEEEPSSTRSTIVR